MPAAPALPFRDRDEAGRALAARLAATLRPQPTADDAVVLALPRGGLPVAHPVAEMLQLPLDVLIVRKLGVPGQPEFAMGAIASGGLRVLNGDVVRLLDISPASIDAVARTETTELARREELYRGARPPPAITGHTVIVVDDGLATGATMRAAVRALRTRSPGRLVVAVPVASADTVESLRGEADEVVAVATPEPFVAVGRWYRDFEQVSDDEVRQLLGQARRRSLREAATRKPESLPTQERPR